MKYQHTQLGAGCEGTICPLPDLGLSARQFALGAPGVPALAATSPSAYSSTS